jgi:hypothetical protein
MAFTLIKFVFVQEPVKCITGRVGNHEGGDNDEKDTNLVGRFIRPSDH